MIFLSAGHHAKHPGTKDPGAINKDGVQEGILTIEFRDLVSRQLTLLGVPHKLDSDAETLSQYVNRIQTGDGSVVCEYHFNAGPPTATGTETLVEVDADRLDLACAKELSATTASILGIRNRGVLSEAQTRHKKLALMSEKGIVVLHEIGFITNDDDLKRYNAKKNELARAHALVLLKYEQIIP